MTVVGGFGFIATTNEYVVIHLISDSQGEFNKFVTGYEILTFSTTNHDINVTRDDILWSWRKLGDKCCYEKDLDDMFW